MEETQDELQYDGALHHWLQRSAAKAYFCSVKAADLELLWNDCVSHVTAAQEQTRHIFHQRAAAPVLQPSRCIFFSSASGLACHRVKSRESRCLFASTDIVTVLAACASIWWQRTGLSAAVSKPCHVRRLSVTSSLIFSFDFPSPHFLHPVHPCLLFFDFFFSNTFCIKGKQLFSNLK